MSSKKLLFWGVVLWNVVVVASDAAANPFLGGSWVWTSYDAGTVPGVISNTTPLSALPAFPAPSVAPDSATATASNTATNAGSSSLLLSPTGSSPAPSGSSTAADGFINFGNGPYPDAGTLTSGGAQAWYLSPMVEHVFGGVPSASQQSDFTSQVLKDVQQTFALSGLAPILTLDPNAPANHTLSIVSNTSYSPNPAAIGITNIGGNGFSFIDGLTPAQSVNDLEWALAHNVAHELMHAFGVAVHHDQTGTYLDASTASWSLLTNPNTVFSPAAVQDILSHNYGRDTSAGSIGAERIDGDEMIAAQPVPETTTIALWGALALGACVGRRCRPAAAA